MNLMFVDIRQEQRPTGQSRAIAHAYATSPGLAWSAGLSRGSLDKNMSFLLADFMYLYYCDHQ
jgi:hypothetical protein